jgi:hypothetical protein
MAKTPEPTGQLPIESAPVSARATASGGSTGLTKNGLTKGGLTKNGRTKNRLTKDGRTEDTDAGSNSPLFRRHPIAFGVVTGVVAVILVAGLTAWGVGAVVATSLTSSTSGMSMGAPTATPTPGPTATTPAAGQKAGGQKGTGQQVAGRVAFRATIQSMAGTSWTILTRKGETVTVTVDSSTQFGTRKVPETVSSFAVGDSVILVATADSTPGGTTGSAVATRVVSAADAANRGTTTPMPGMTTPPTA